MGSASSKQAENESNSKELEWIKSALIALSRTSKQLLAKCNRRDKKTDYLRNIETSSWILKQRLSQISCTDIEHSMETINKLTQCLDTIFNIVQKADHTDEAAVHQDRRRNQIQDMVKERTPWDHSLVERLSFSLSNAVSCWYNLQLTMERLTDEFERDNHMTDEIENLKISKDLQAPDEDSCQFLDKVFSAAQCTCHGSAERDLRLRLGTYRRRGKKPNLTSLCILLGRDIETGPLMRWHELDISTGSRVETQSLEKHCICHFLKNHDTHDYRLDLILIQDMLTLSHSRPTENILQRKSLQGQIDLRSLLLIEEKDWNINMKWALAILLSYALLYLHGGPRVETVWRRENIVFFHDGSEVPLRPFLSNTLVETRKQPGVPYPHPHIIMLGAILLEIFLGESLECFLKRKDIYTGENIYYLAWKVFEQPEFFCFPPLFRQVIRACLNPATFSHLGNNNQAIRSEFFRRVICPLENAAVEHFGTFGSGNLDETIAERFNLALGVAQTRLHSLSIKPSLKKISNEEESYPVHSPAHDEKNLSMPCEAPLPEDKVVILRKYVPGKTYESYTVAVVCAIEFEMSAVRYMLDREHDRLPTKEGDSNIYVLGELHGHDLVLACLPGSQGKGAAATVATNMARTFPCISWWFFVGIGGGVPSKKHDIRLGDVVVSMPEGQYGGVVQYDLGKETDGGFVRKGFLSPPPPLLRSAVVRMRSDHRRSENKAGEFLSAMLQKGRRLSVYQRPSWSLDILFDPGYSHDPSNTICESCDQQQRVHRTPRELEGPEIHYGLIASGDRVVKSTLKRDEIIRDVGDILCFEMEAAGLMSEFPCIVIRGISDYADSHKNDDWQHYAAATAAACTKELLTYIDPKVPPGMSASSADTLSNHGSGAASHFFTARGSQTRGHFPL